jgi:hypothetical protein
MTVNARLVQSKPFTERRRNDPPWWLPDPDMANKPLWRSGQFPTREEPVLIEREEHVSPIPDRISTVKRGEHYRWEGVRMVVTRVAKDGSWADIACASGDGQWRKRQPLPMPLGTERVVLGPDS